MNSQWTEIKELQRRYLKADGTEIVINNPAALFISKSGTHYLSNEDDTERAIVPWPFQSIHIEVEDSSDWKYPPPRFTEDVSSCVEAGNFRIDNLVKEFNKTWVNGPWSTSDLFQKVPE